MTPVPNVRWPNGYEAFYRQLRIYAPRLLDGTLVALDPSSGGSSAPGFAIYKRGELITSGEIKLSKRMAVYERLQVLHGEIQRLTPEPPDVFAIEELRGTGFSHVHLVWSVGVSISAARTPAVIEVPLNFWRAVAKAMPGYFKGNAQDAELIGGSMIQWLRERTNAVNTVVLPKPLDPAS